MRWRIPLAAVLTLFVAVSCQDAPVGPAADVATAPAFNFSNNDGLLGNGKIFRHGHNFGWIGWDVERQLIGHFATFDPSVSFCGLGQAMEMIDAQHIFNNPDIANEIEHLMEQGDVWVELYDWTGLWDPFAGCANWAAADLLATGEMRIVSTDNDLLGFLGGHDRNNSYGISGNGRLDLEDGGKTNIAYHFRQTVNDDKGVNNVVERLNISNDPR